MKSPASLLVTLLLWAAPAAALTLRVGSGATSHRTKAQRTPPPPRAILVDGPSMSATLPTAALLAADDVFGEVFMAGMSIAFAAVGATVLVGVVIRGKYDEIEQSMFEAQDEQSEREAAKENQKGSTAADDFFGQTVPQPSTQPPASETEPSMGE